MGKRGGAPAARLEELWDERRKMKGRDKAIRESQSLTLFPCPAGRAYFFAEPPKKVAKMSAFKS